MKNLILTLILSLTIMPGFGSETVTEDCKQEAVNYQNFVSEQVMIMARTYEKWNEQHEALSSFLGANLIASKLVTDKSFEADLYRKAVAIRIHAFFEASDTSDEYILKFIRADMKQWNIFTAACRYLID